MPVSTSGLPLLLTPRWAAVAGLSIRTEFVTSLLTEHESLNLAARRLRELFYEGLEFDRQLVAPLETPGHHHVGPEKRLNLGTNLPSA
jgi:hypothetical protein